MPATDAFHVLDEFARGFPPDSWMLVGGLMVHAHALRAGVENARVTLDADIVVEVAVTSYREAATAAEAIGFSRTESLDHAEPVYRFARRDEVIDIMVPDRGGEVRLGGRAVLAASGTASALRRTETFTTPDGTRIRIPDLTAALSIKGAATETASLNPVRHAQDGVALFACVIGPGARAPSKSERANINTLIRRMGSPEAWSLASDQTRHRAIKGVQWFRPDWTLPEFQERRRGLRRTAGPGPGQRQ